MQYNILGYWQHLQNLPDGHRDKPSPRICRLMSVLFERWQNQQPFPRWEYFGHLKDHFIEEDWQRIRQLSVMRRKGLAVKKMLEMLGESGWADGLCKMHPDELIVGSMPPYSVGQGKELMRYLTEQEALQGELTYLNERSPFGHIVPDHERVVKQGLNSLIAECRDRAEQTDDPAKKDFYASVRYCLEGAIAYAQHFASRAKALAEQFRRLLERSPSHPQAAIWEERVHNMRAVHERLQRIPAEPCESFTDAVQCIFLMNCCLHYTGEITSLGRLDQILQPYYAADELSEAAAQEVIDCLWVKLDEQVVLDRRHIVDRFTDSDGALLGAGGASNFDQGALTNQWMQQVTIGGVIADNEAEAKDACNKVSEMCLHAARKLPFNCPTLDLRLHKNSPKPIMELAAQALLSGGAHPVLLNDDKLIPALQERSGGKVELKSARNYACDGCYETVFAGETEFSFGYVPGLDVLEKALNSGAGFAFSGPTYLRGTKGSYRTVPAAEIKSWDQFLTILESHIQLGAHRFIHNILNAYGYKAPISPSPFLSALISGCLEKGRDLADGGARYHMFAPLMTGISTVGDSLYVIKTLVFDRQQFSLEELVACLRTNWGASSEVVGLKLSDERIKEIRALCMEQPKFGHGQKEVDQMAWLIAELFVKCIGVAKDHPMHASAWQKLKEKYGDAFELLFTPGVGTFEQYVFGGSFAGATADGRGAFETSASDLSASPYYAFLDPLEEVESADGQVAYKHKRSSSLLEALGSWNSAAFEAFSDGGPADYNIREDFPEDKLVDVIQAFADGKGGNIMTVTVANPETMKAAEEQPEDYNLLRVRMGGWTEYFSVLFPSHKAQHRRRPLYLP